MLVEPDPELEAIRAKIRADATAAAAEPRAVVVDVPIEASDATLAQLASEHEVLVVDVWAPWCGPCRIVGPIVDQLAKELAGTVTFAKVNADHNPRTMQAFGIQGIPTMLIFREGQLVDRVVGALPKAALEAQIMRNVTGRGRAARPGPRR